MSATFSVFLYLLTIVAMASIASSDLIVLTVIPFYLTLSLVCWLDAKVTQWRRQRSIDTFVLYATGGYSSPKLKVESHNLMESPAGQAITFVALTLYGLEIGISLVR